jgi:transglycosylase-like protein
VPEENVMIDTRTNTRRAVVLVVAMSAFGWAAMRVPAVASEGAQAHQPAALVPLPRPRDELAAANATRWFAAVEQARQRDAAAQQLEQLGRAQLWQQRLDMWDELAQCESGGNWHVRDRFGGGLGIYVGTWQMFDGDQFAANPGDATKEHRSSSPNASIDASG